MVVIKVAVVLLVIFAGIPFVRSSNFTPMTPFGLDGLSLFGIYTLGQTAPDHSPVGMLAEAAIVFFAYIGFDTVSAQAEETVRYIFVFAALTSERCISVFFLFLLSSPEKNLPLAVLLSLSISTVLYVLVALCLLE